MNSFLAFSSNADYITIHEYINRQFFVFFSFILSLFFIYFKCFLNLHTRGGTGTSGWSVCHFFFFLCALSI
jgi:hypothetical protein